MHVQSPIYKHANEHKDVRETWQCSVKVFPHAGATKFEWDVAVVGCGATSIQDMKHETLIILHSVHPFRENNLILSTGPLLIFTIQCDWCEVWWLRIHCWWNWGNTQVSQSFWTVSVFLYMACYRRSVWLSTSMKAELFGTVVGSCIFSLKEVLVGACWS